MVTRQFFFMNIIINEWFVFHELLVLPICLFPEVLNYTHFPGFLVLFVCVVMHVPGQWEMKSLVVKTEGTPATCSKNMQHATVPICRLS